MIAHEVIQFTKRWKTNGYLLKLDFEKASDLVYVRKPPSYGVRSTVDLLD